MVNFITPEDRAHWLTLRAEDITSTESPALFDLSPYMTEFELYHTKLVKKIVELEDNERMKWGRRLEPVIATGTAEDLGIKVRQLNQYARHEEVSRMGASFDYEIISHDRGPGVFEIKNVDSLIYRNQWEKDEAPEHIEIQFQHQLEVVDRDWGYIVPFVGGNVAKPILRERDRKMGRGIANAIERFWQRVDEKDEPDPEFDRDADFIISMYQQAGGGQVVFPEGEDEEKLIALAETYQMMTENRKMYDAGAQACQAQILKIIGEADNAFWEGFKVSAKEVGESVVPEYTRKSYRGFKLTKSSKKPEQQKEAA